jgi:hypothetical protein
MPLNQEIRDLRTTIELQERKRKRSEKAIICKNSLNLEEGTKLIQISHGPDTASASAAVGVSSRRNYHQIGHKRASCTSRQI